MGITCVTNKKIFICYNCNLLNKQNNKYIKKHNYVNTKKSNKPNKCESIIEKKHTLTLNKKINSLKTSFFKNQEQLKSNLNLFEKNKENFKSKKELLINKKKANRYTNQIYKDVTDQNIINSQNNINLNLFKAQYNSDNEINLLQTSFRAQKGDRLIFAWIEAGTTIEFSVTGMWTVDSKIYSFCDEFGYKKGINYLKNKNNINNNDKTNYLRSNDLYEERCNKFNIGSLLGKLLGHSNDYFHIYNKRRIEFEKSGPLLLCMNLSDRLINCIDLNLKGYMNLIIKNINKITSYEQIENRLKFKFFSLDNKDHLIELNNFENSIFYNINKLRDNPALFALLYLGGEINLNYLPKKPEINKYEYNKKFNSLNTIKSKVNLKENKFVNSRIIKNINNLNLADEYKIYLNNIQNLDSSYDDSSSSNKDSIDNKYKNKTILNINKNKRKNLIKNIKIEKKHKQTSDLNLIIKGNSSKELSNKYVNQNKSNSFNINFKNKTIANKDNNINNINRKLSSNISLNSNLTYYEYKMNTNNIYNQDNLENYMNILYIKLLKSKYNYSKFVINHTLISLAKSQAKHLSETNKISYKNANKEYIVDRCKRTGKKIDNAYEIIYCYNNNDTPLGIVCKILFTYDKILSYNISDIILNDNLILIGLATESHKLKGNILVLEFAESITT